jgi:hypothetical protein
MNNEFECRYFFDETKVIVPIYGIDPINPIALICDIVNLIQKK